MEIERRKLTPAEEKAQEFARVQAQANRADLDYMALVAGVDLPTQIEDESMTTGMTEVEHE